MKSVNLLIINYVYTFMLYRKSVTCFKHSSVKSPRHLLGGIKLIIDSVSLWNYINKRKTSQHTQVNSSLKFSSVQSLSRVRLFATPWIAARQASLSITNSQSSPRLTSIESVMPSSHLILCRPLLLLSPIPPSMSLFQWVNSSHEVAKVLELQL